MTPPTTATPACTATSSWLAGALTAALAAATLAGVSSLSTSGPTASPSAARADFLFAAANAAAAGSDTLRLKSDDDDGPCAARSGNPDRVPCLQGARLLLVARPF